MAAAEKRLLQADAGVFDTGNDAVGTKADKGDNRWTPAPDFGLEAPTAGAKVVVAELIGTGGGALDDVGDAELEVKQQGFFKGREKTRRKSAAMQSGPTACVRSNDRKAEKAGRFNGPIARRSTS